jgi:poly(3-hydroxybutyrate) depolymerase
VTPRAATAALATALLLGAPPAAADRVVPKSGKPVRGTVFETETEVRVNPYRSRVPEMTYEVVRLSREDVRRIEREPDLPGDLLVRHRALAPDDVPGRVALAKEAREARLDADAERLLEEALAQDAAHAEALSLYGGATRFAARRKGDPALDPALAKDLRDWLAIEDGAARAAEARRIEADRGFPARPEVLERAWRSARLPRGRREDVPLTLRSDRHPGGVYSIVVPESYDPLVPAPLVFALHGGGVGGKAADQVVGSGRDALNLYVSGAARTGSILVCPTALAAPWSATPNEPFLLSVLEEVTTLWNVDLDRVHLTGHSMGGFGSWWFGPRHTDVFATVSPTAGGGSGGTKALRDARTGVFVFHGTDDPVVGVEGSRAGAKALLEAGADVVYLELDGAGHGFPAAAQQELFDVMERHRLHVARRKSAWPRSSFARKVGPDERRYLGDPKDAWAGAAEPAALGDLVEAIERGGGAAERAVATLGKEKPAGAAKALAKVLRSPKATEDARAWAARALGALGDATAAPALSTAVATAESSRLARACATALRDLASPEGAAGLEKALARWSEAYGGKFLGDRIQHGDFEAVCLALADLVEAYAVCGPKEGAVATIRRHAADAVLADRREVAASERAGQDPEEPRARLAEAVGRAYATLGAPEDFHRALLAALEGHPRAATAAGTGRESPLSRPER